MHARRAVASRGGRYRAVRTRAYAYNQFPPTNLQTYQAGPSIRPGPSFRAGQGTILAHGGSTCSNPRAAARSARTDRKDIRFRPPPLFPRAASLPSYLILLEEIEDTSPPPSPLPLPDGEEKETAGTWL